MYKFELIPKGTLVVRNDSGEYGEISVDSTDYSVYIVWDTDLDRNGMAQPRFVREYKRSEFTVFPPLSPGDKVAYLTTSAVMIGTVHKVKNSREVFVIFDAADFGAVRMDRKELREVSASISF